MSSGFERVVLICSPVASTSQANGIDVQICPPVGGQYFHLETQQAYLLAPSSAQYIDSIAQPFDYASAAGFWGVAFTTVISLWLTAKGAGAVVNFVRRA
nr:hypothetical protein [Pandoraea sp. ISTKB]